MNRFDKYIQEQKEETLSRMKCDTERHRQGFATIVVTDKDGNSIENAHMKIVQTGHQFKFGCNCFMLDQFPDEGHNKAYREMFPKLFNYTVAPFYWSDFEPTDGAPRIGKDAPNVYRRPAPEKVLQYCKENNIGVKGHPLFWHLFMPDWLVRDKDEAMYRIDRHLREIAEEYSERICDWDTVNESLSKSPYISQHDAMADDYVEKVFYKADKYFPNNRLFINETTHCWGKLFNREVGAYYLQVDNMRRKGLRIDGIGLQYHLFQSPEKLVEEAETYLNPQRLFDVMDYMGKFNIPLHVSEITIPAYGGTPESLEEQAELTEWLYRIWFSHPKAEAIVWWNFVDGTGAYAPLGSEEGENYFHGGLLNFDMTKKPVYNVLDRLINHEWHTEAEIDMKDGKAKFQGYFGDYDVEITHNGVMSKHQIRFLKNGKKEFSIKI